MSSFFASFFLLRLIAVKSTAYHPSSTVLHSREKALHESLTYIRRNLVFYGYQRLTYMGLLVFVLVLFSDLVVSSNKLTAVYAEKINLGTAPTQQRLIEAAALFGRRVRGLRGMPL
ncbi:hypothetical protein CPC08DRAFT_481379 [Agrocybe pediades]|nr:hypothetical protein CPC08DRAFT_481379 [Agrocybe pediades]